MNLEVLLGDPPVCVSFGVVDNFVGRIVLGTSKINWIVVRIFWLEGRVVYIHSWPVVILTPYSFDEVTYAIEIDFANIEYNHIQTMEHRKDKDIESWSITVKCLDNASYRRVANLVLVRRSSAALVTLDPYSYTAKKRTEVTAKAVMQVVLNKPFYVLTGNFFARPIYIPKRMYVANGWHPPDNIMYLHWSRSPKTPQKRGARNKSRRVLWISPTLNRSTP